MILYRHRKVVEVCVATEALCRAEWRSLDRALVGLSRGVVLLLVELVAGSGESTRGTVGQRVLSGNVALGLLLVGLLGSLGVGALDALRDVVGGVLDRVDGLADDALVGVVDVGSRHFECEVWGLLVKVGWKSVFEEFEVEEWLVDGLTGGGGRRFL